MKLFLRIHKKTTFLYLMFLFPISLLAQDKAFTIDGQFASLHDGQRVKLWLLDTHKDLWAKTAVDSAIAKNGSFHLTASNPGNDLWREYWLELGDESNGRLFNMLIGDREHIVLSSKQDFAKMTSRWPDGHDVDATGDYYEKSKDALMSAIFLYERTYNYYKYLATKVVDSVGFDGRILTGIFSTRDRVSNGFAMEIFTSNPRSLEPYYTTGCLFWTDRIVEQVGHPAFLADYYQKLSDQQKKSYYGRFLSSYAAISIGQTFPPFILPDAAGKPLAVADVIAKNKVTLVHFWADKSYKRKEFEDELLILYKKYQGKGLAIVGVNSDKYAEQWKEAIQNNSYPWPNVNDNKGRESLVEKVYHEYEPHAEQFENADIHNTTNVLVDAHGKIIAWDVSGVELQWYLWKYLENDNK